jgi:membrane-associated phospholipid phosphatase
VKRLTNPFIAPLLAVFSTGVAFAQTTQTSVPSEPVHRQSCVKQPDYGDLRISWVRLIPDIGCDQKRIWTFPARLAKGHDVVPAFAVIGLTAALAASDPQIEGPLRTAKSFHTFNQVFSSTNTALITALVPGAMYVTGLVTHDSYAKKTALLSGEVAADVEVVDIALKSVTQRLRPRDVPPGRNLSDSWFEYGKTSVTGGSFPSGHAIVSFGIATVIAHRYSEHRWVPWVAYGVAGLISFSRLPQGAHFPSDVFMGAALGYSIGRFVVLQ